MRNTLKNEAIDDILIMGMSISFAMILIKTHTIQNMLASTRELEMIGSFIGGMFFTSLFTTVPAVIALGEIAQVYSLLGTAMFGAAGALFIDTLIFIFFRDKISAHATQFFKKKEKKERVKHALKVHFKWLPFIIGGIILASPLPDELAIGIMGFSKMKLRFFMLCSYVFNFIGILLIGLAARALM